MKHMLPKIHRYTTHDMKMIVNVFLVETASGVVVIDTATALSSSREIRDIVVNKIRKPLKAILITHGHPDHYIGAGEIAGDSSIPIIATQATGEFARYQDKYKIHTLKKGYGENFPKERMFPNTEVKDGESITIDGIDFTVNDLGPCESGDDCLWSIRIDGDEHVFVGDILYNHCHCYFRDGHALNWLKALDAMLEKYDHTTLFHPGHGEDCGCEIIIWQKAYIETFLYTLKSLLGKRDRLTEAEQDVLFQRMQSFLPNKTNIFLLKYEPEETIKALLREGI